MATVKLWGIWSIKTNGWVSTTTVGLKTPQNCTYTTKRAATADIKLCLVHEKDYEVREYVRITA